MEVGFNLEQLICNYLLGCRGECVITAICRHVVPAIVTAGLIFFSGAAMSADADGALAAIPKIPELPKMPELPKLPAADEVKIEYFVAVEGKQSGPFKCAKLFEMANKHVLTPESKVWKSGMQSWKRAGSMQDLDDIFAAVPPPIIDETLPIDEKPQSSALPCAPKPKKWWWPF